MASTMTKPTLTYSVARLILEEAGVDYDFVPLGPHNWPEKKKELNASGKLTFGQVPLYEEPGFSLVQSGAIVRYLAKKHGLAGNNDLIETAQIDAIYEGAIDLLEIFLTWRWRTGPPANHSQGITAYPIGPLHDSSREEWQQWLHSWL